MEHHEVAALLGILQGTYGYMTITEETIPIWRIALAQPPAIPGPAALYAARWWIAYRDKPPSPADLRDVVDEEVLGIPSAEAAWTTLTTYLRGWYPGFPSERAPLPELIRQAASDIGGTYLIRHSERPDDVHRRFIDAYTRRRREHVRGLDVAAAWTAFQLGAGLDPRKALT